MRNGSGVSEGDADDAGGERGNGLGVRQKAPPPQVVGTWAGGRQERNQELGVRGGVARARSWAGRCVFAPGTCVRCGGRGAAPEEARGGPRWGCRPPSRQSVYIQHEKCQYPGHVWVT